jgi:hypothetical protein
MIGKYVITIAYSALIAGGVFVGVRQIYQGFRKPAELLNPLFGNKIAIRLFTVHIVVVSCDLFVIGPLAVAHKSPCTTGAAGACWSRRRCRSPRT